MTNLSLKVIMIAINHLSVKPPGVQSSSRTGKLGCGAAESLGQDNSAQKMRGVQATSASTGTRSLRDAEEPASHAPPPEVVVAVTLTASADTPMPLAKEVLISSCSSWHGQVSVAKVSMVMVSMAVSIVMVIVIVSMVVSMVIVMVTSILKSDMLQQAA